MKKLILTCLILLIGFSAYGQVKGIQIRYDEIQFGVSWNRMVCDSFIVKVGTLNPDTTVKAIYRFATKDTITKIILPKTCPDTLYLSVSAKILDYPTVEGKEVCRFNPKVFAVNFVMDLVNDRDMIDISDFYKFYADWQKYRSQVVIKKYRRKL